MKIGITERGDAGINLEWVNKINTVDGAILISKNLTDMFIASVINCERPVIVHCTCTGFGGTKMEPNVPDYKTQLNNLKKLIDSGFDPKMCVLRVDPIFPTESGIKKASTVIEQFLSMSLGISRVRISILDEYFHVKQRFQKLGWRQVYSGFSASKYQTEEVMKMIASYDSTGIEFECCAEPLLVRLAEENNLKNLIHGIGCVSEKDISLMGLSMPNELYINPQNRSGCCCLSCKKELLSNKHPCKNGCVYCYWK